VLSFDQNFVEQTDGSGILEEFAAAIDGRERKENIEKRDTYSRDE
jgi:hypothetical protein